MGGGGGRERLIQGSNLTLPGRHTSDVEIDNNNNDFISIALFHVKHAQLR